MNNLDGKSSLQNKDYSLGDTNLSFRLRRTRTLGFAIWFLILIFKEVILAIGIKGRLSYFTNVKLLEPIRDISA